MNILFIICMISISIFGAMWFRGCVESIESSPDDNERLSFSEKIEFAFSFIIGMPVLLLYGLVEHFVHKCH